MPISAAAILSLACSTSSRWPTASPTPPISRSWVTIRRRRSISPSATRPSAKARVPSTSPEAADGCPPRRRWRVARGRRHRESGGGLTPGGRHLRRSCRHGEGDGAVPAAEAEQVAGGRWRRDGAEEDAGAGADAAGGEHAAVGAEHAAVEGEHAAVGGEPRVQVGQDEVDHAGAAGGLGAFGEVVLSHVGRPYQRGGSAASLRSAQGPAWGVRTSFAPGKAGGLTAAYEPRLGDDTFYAEIRDSGLELGRGPATTRPDAVLTRTPPRCARPEPRSDRTRRRRAGRRPPCSPARRRPVRSARERRRARPAGRGGRTPRRTRPRGRRPRARCRRTCRVRARRGRRPAGRPRRRAWRRAVPR